MYYTIVIMKQLYPESTLLMNKGNGSIDRERKARNHGLVLVIGGNKN